MNPPSSIHIFAVRFRSKCTIAAAVGHQIHSECWDYTENDYAIAACISKGIKSFDASAFEFGFAVGRSSTLI